MEKSVYLLYNGVEVSKNKITTFVIVSKRRVIHSELDPIVAKSNITLSSFNIKDQLSTFIYKRLLNKMHHLYLILSLL